MDSIVYDKNWSVGDEFKFALISDPHIAVGEENRELKKVLEKCKKEGIKIWLNGDVADFISVKDPRYNKASDKAQFAGIINEQIEWVSSFLEPYADLIEIFGMGNHEDVLIRHYGVDPIRFIIRDLTRGTNRHIHYGAYRGFIKLQFKYKNGGRKKSLVVFRHHGGGGSAPVTGGAIDINRVMSGFDADIYWLGHKHKATYRETSVVGINNAGNLEQKVKKGVMTPGFQKPYTEKDYNATGGEWSFEDRFYDTNPTGWALLKVRPYNLPDGNDMALDYTITMRN